MEKNKSKNQNQMYQNNDSRCPSNTYNPPANNNRAQVLPEYDINQPVQRKNVASHWAPKSKFQQQEQMNVDNETDQNQVDYNQNNYQTNTNGYTKKSKDIGYIYIPDKETKIKLNGLVKEIPEGGTNYIFWYSKSEPETWGLTIKQVADNEEDEGFSSQHTWKATWFNKDGFLKVANHCKSIAQDILDDGKIDSYTQITNIFKSYSRNKSKKKQKNK